jgi:glutathione S-transferase
MPAPTSSLCLYRFPLSGHAHRAELFLSLLGLPARLVDVDLVGGEQKKPEFLNKNPFGQVPVLEDGDVTISDSNSILVYLALRYDQTRRWYPSDPVIAARIQRWLSVAAGELHSGPGAARLTALFKFPGDPDTQKAKANLLLSLLDTHLARSPFLATDHPTIADLAIYTYTAHAPEGGVSLEPYQNVRAWLGRIEALPGFVPMKRAGTPAAA